MQGLRAQWAKHQGHQEQICSGYITNYIKKTSGALLCLCETTWCENSGKVHLLMRPDRKLDTDITTVLHIIYMLYTVSLFFFYWLHLVTQSAFS